MRPPTSPACSESTDPEVFFNHIWPIEDDKPGPADEEALEYARAFYCRACPARRKCLNYAMEYEIKDDAGRYGLFGYLTPGQRASVKRRKCLTCPRCGTVRDPVLLEQGRYECPVKCGEPKRLVPPIPLEGDQWSKRHTTLARRTAAWIVDNVPVGGDIPSISVLADTLGARRTDLSRVYAALVADGTLDRRGASSRTRHTRRGQTATMLQWSPPFMDD